MAQSATHPTPNFWSGFRSGAFSGALMVSILTVVGLAFGTPLALAFSAHALIGMATLITSTSLFGGIMAVKRGHEAHATAVSAYAAPTMAMAQAQGVAPVITPQMEIAETSVAASAPGQSWAERSGHAESAPSRLQQILDNGALSDAGRAQAILAEREQSAGTPVLGA
jgi:hypothetical protein